MKEEKAPLWAGRQSGISRSEVTESVEYGDEAGGVEEMRGLGEDGWKRGGRCWIKMGQGLWRGRRGIMVWSK